MAETVSLLDFESILVAGSGAACALGLFCAFVVLGYLGAASMLATARTSVRLAAAVVIAWWLMTALFYVLTALGIFRLIVALPLLAIAAWAAHAFSSTGTTARECFRRDWASSCSWGSGLRGGEGFVVLAFAVSLLFRLLKGLSSPALAWDSLTYHLVHPARWVQTGGFTRDIAPGNWGVYEYFPIGGEIVWGWAMLPVSSEALVPLAGGLVLLSIALAVYACLRELETPSPRATMAALSVACVPAVFSFTTSGYVDNAMLALAALGTTFIVRDDQTRGFANLLLAAAAFGLCASVKHPAAAFLLPVTLALLVQSWRGATSVGHALTRIGWLLPVAAICLLHLIRTGLDTGSPIYPFALEIPGWIEFAGNPQFIDHHDPARQVLQGKEAPALELIQQLMGHSPPWNLNFGPAGWVVSVLGAWGFLALLRARTTIVGGLVLLSFLLITIGLATSDTAAFTRTYSWSASGRLFSVGFLALVIPAATLRSRWLDGLWFALPLTSLLVARPWTASPTELMGTASLAVGFSIVAGLAIGCLRLRRNVGPGIPWPRVTAAALVATFVCGVVVENVRDHVRSEVHSEAAQGLAFDAHPLDPALASSWPIWQYLDHRESERIAVAVGWLGVLPNGFRYPLFGQHLQHSLHTIALSKSGEIIESRLRGRITAEADLEAWLDRLLEHDISLLVTLEPPTSFEAAWASKHPEWFEPVSWSLNGQSVAYRIDRARLASRPRNLD